MDPSQVSAQSSDLISTVRAATQAATRGRFGAFDLGKASRGEIVLAPLVGLYLGYAVVRLPEVFVQLAIPRGPMIMMLIFLGMLGIATPPDGWKRIWQRSRPLRLATVMMGIVVATLPVGIWPKGSFDTFRQQYIISFVIFLTCLVFLRDRKALRIAATIFVLSVTMVSANVVATYDPNAVVYNEDGEPRDPAEVAARPELRRLAAVGVSLDPNDFGAIIATAFPLALFLSIGSLRRRLVWTGAAAVMVVAVVPTQSRGSMLGMLAAATVVIGTGARGWRRILTILLVGAGVSAFVYMAVRGGESGRFSEFGAGDYNMTDDGRIFFWRQGMIWMLKRPWGFGIGNFPTYFGELNGPERAAHSSWVQYGMELGVAGLVTFIALCASLVGGLRRMRQAAVEARNTIPDATSYETQAGHMLAMLTGVLVTGSFLSNAYYPMMYMALGMCAATLLGSPFGSEATPPTPPAPVLPAVGVRRRRPFRGGDAEPTHVG